ncbi:unnamed protein product [Cyprideis torosa]|uniref:Uncharacterized protein n=1 Tax=Cyprideis torosa TaxID=163714 RepID=A0A7R8W4P9_9CRUS|nr:unnamed protein product [Cyprideis torosa]CAG0884289.1 unnamed protein product [Cyprideis torosa]
MSEDAAKSAAPDAVEEEATSGTEKSDSGPDEGFQSFLEIGVEPPPLVYPWVPPPRRDDRRSHDRYSRDRSRSQGRYGGGGYGGGGGGGYYESNKRPRYDYNRRY